MNLQIDPSRLASYEDKRSWTGIYVRAQTISGKWVSADIAILTKESLYQWLRSRNGKNEWAENVVGILLGHGPFDEFDSPAFIPGDEL